MQPKHCITQFKNIALKFKHISNDQVAQLVRVPSRYTKDADLIPGQVTYKKQAMNV